MASQDPQLGLRHAVCEALYCGPPQHCWCDLERYTRVDSPPAQFRFEARICYRRSISISYGACPIFGVQVEINIHCVEQPSPLTVGVWVIRPLFQTDIGHRVPLDFLSYGHIETLYFIIRLSELDIFHSEPDICICQGL